MQRAWSEFGGTTWHPPRAVDPAAAAPPVLLSPRPAEVGKRALPAGVPLQGQGRWRFGGASVSWGRKEKSCLFHFLFVFIGFERIPIVLRTECFFKLTYFDNTDWRGGESSPSRLRTIRAEPGAGLELPNRA